MNMDDAETHHLLRPLPPPIAPETTFEDRDDFNNFTFRFFFIVFIALLSLWANNEASKGFAISIINDAGDTEAGKRFDLFYVSNDRATRLIIERSNFAEDILYPTHHYTHTLLHLHSKKEINCVVLRLSSRNLTSPMMTESGKDGKFVIHLSPSILVHPNFKHAMFLAVQRGMARIWLWDCQSNADTSLINGVVEYITGMAVSGVAQPSHGGVELPEYCGSGCWKDNKDPRSVAQFLNCCEGK